MFLRAFPRRVILLRSGAALDAESVRIVSASPRGMATAEAPGRALYLVCSGIPAAIVPASTRTAPPWITAYR